MPGLWNKILGALMQNERNTLVQEVNLILDDLRKITDLGIYIPDSLYLTKIDIVENDAFNTYLSFDFV